MIIDDLVRELPSVRHAVLLSPDGLVLDHSSTITTTDAEYLASMAAVLHSLAHRASTLLDAGHPHHVKIRCDNAALVLIPTSPHQQLALTTTADTDPDDIVRRTH